MEYSAALYMRLSKEDVKKDSGSIGSQKKLLYDFAAENHFSVFGEYIDEGFSGTNFERPAFRRMISDIESGKINLVITKDLSRLGRDYISAGRYTEIYFPENGVRYISVADGYDSENSSADMIPFRNIVNEMYARDTSRKIRLAFSARMKAGDFVGAFAPFGYVRSSENRHRLCVDKNAAGTVQRIFRERAAGKSFEKIAAGLDSDNIPTPLDHRNKSGKTRNWSSSAIFKIIRNKVYLGHTVQGKTEKISFRTKISAKVPEEKWFVVKNTHEAIIDPETFEKANSIG